MPDLKIPPRPDRICVTPAPGVYPHPDYGNVDFSPATLQAMLAAWREMYRQDLPLKASHSVPDGDEDGIWAWLSELDLEEDGRIWVTANWTPPGSRAWDNGQIRMLSPEVIRDYKGPEGSAPHVLVGAAATSHPYFKPPVLASLFRESFAEPVEVEAAVVVELYAEPRWVAHQVDLPIADGDPEWDANAAKARLFERDEEGWKDAFLVYDAANPSLRGSYKFPVADVVDGQLRVVPAAVRAARSRIAGADLPGDVKERLNTISEELMRKVQEKMTMSDELAQAKAEAQQFAEQAQALADERDQIRSELEAYRQRERVQSFAEGLKAVDAGEGRRLTPAAVEALSAFAEKHPEIDTAELLDLAKSVGTMPVGQQTEDEPVAQPAPLPPVERVQLKFQELIVAGKNADAAWREAMQELSEDELRELTFGPAEA